MNNVKFLYSLEKDSWNIWTIVNNKFRRFGNPSISTKIDRSLRGKSLKESIKKIKKINQEIYESKIIDAFIQSLEKLWNKIEKEYFNRLKKITGKELKGKFECYITTIGTCPYNPEEKWFMNSMSYSLPMALSTIGHELLHLHFHDYYFDKISEQIGRKKTHDLREALTILLNLEFKDLLIGFDKGYEQHKKLRNFIKNEWKKEKNFDRLLEKCIKELKDKNITSF